MCMPLQAELRKRLINHVYLSVFMPRVFPYFCMPTWAKKKKKKKTNCCREVSVASNYTLFLLFTAFLTQWYKEGAKLVCVALFI